MKDRANLRNNPIKKTDSRTPEYVRALFFSTNDIL